MTRRALRITLLLVGLLVVVVFFWQGKQALSLPDSLDSLLNQAEQALLPPAEQSMTPREGTTTSVHVLDVGQGEAILIMAPNANVLIDSGEYGQEQTVLAYLAAQGVEKLDIVIATHPHSDHIGAMDTIVNKLEIGRIIMPEIPDELLPTTRAFRDLLKRIESKGLVVTPALPGDEYYLGADTTLTILAPLFHDYENLNDFSVVAMLRDGETSFLFTGDMEELSELDLLGANYDITADVLSVGHHGSLTSTNALFLQAVQPQIGVVSCGLDNSYGHPHREIIASLQAQAATVYRTDIMGAILLETDGTELTVRTQREEAK